MFVSLLTACVLRPLVSGCGMGLEIREGRGGGGGGLALPTPSLRRPPVSRRSLRWKLRGVGGVGGRGVLCGIFCATCVRVEVRSGGGRVCVCVCWGPGQLWARMACPCYCSPLRLLPRWHAAGRRMQTEPLETIETKVMRTRTQREEAKKNAGHCAEAPDIERWTACTRGRGSAPLRRPGDRVGGTVQCHVFSAPPPPSPSLLEVICGLCSGAGVAVSIPLHPYPLHRHRYPRPSSGLRSRGALWRGAVQKLRSSPPPPPPLLQQHRHRRTPHRTPTGTARMRQ